MKITRRTEAERSFASSRRYWWDRLWVRLTGMLCLVIVVCTSAHAAPVLQIVSETEVLTFSDTDMESAAIDGAELNLRIAPGAQARMFEFTSRFKESEVLIVVCWSVLQKLTLQEALNTPNLRVSLSNGMEAASVSGQSVGSYCEALGF